MRCRMLRNLVTCGAAMASGGPGLALASDFERTIPAKEIRHVTIERTVGDVVIQGWDDDVVKVVCHEEPDNDMVTCEEELGIQVSEHEIVIGSRKPPSVKSFFFGYNKRDHDLTISIPRNKSVSVKTVSGEMTITATNGRMQLTTVSGDIEVASCGSSVEAKTVSGDIDVTGVKADLSMKSVSGDLSAQGIDAFLVEAKTVSGDLDFNSTNARTVRISTTSGDVLYAGRIAKDGGLEVSTLSGDVKLRLDSSLEFRVEARSQSGTIRIDRRMEFAERSEHRIRAQAGQGGPYLQVKSFSGTIHIK